MKRRAPESLESRQLMAANLGLAAWPALPTDLPSTDSVSVISPSAMADRPSGPGNGHDPQAIIAILIGLAKAPERGTAQQATTAAHDQLFAELHNHDRPAFDRGFLAPGLAGVTHDLEFEGWS